MSCDDEFDPEQLARDSADFFRRVVELEPGQELSGGLGAWRDAVVFLTGGGVEVRGGEGGRRRFTRGAVLCLTPRVRPLPNNGAEPSRLIAMSPRPHPPERQR